MLGPKYRKKFSVINAGIVAEIIERYLSDPDSINESEYQLLLSTFKFESNGVNSNSGSISFDKRDRAYLYADLNPLEKNESANYNFEDSKLNQIYLKTIGWEFSHLRNNDEKNSLFN